MQPYSADRSLGGKLRRRYARLTHRRPAKLDDDLVVVSRVTDVRAASCAIHQRVMRGREVLAEATVTAALLTSQGRPRRQPADWIERFRSIATKEGIE